MSFFEDRSRNRNSPTYARRVTEAALQVKATRRQYASLDLCVAVAARHFAVAEPDVKDALQPGVA